MKKADEITNASQDAFLGVERSLLGKRWRSRVGDDQRALTFAQRLGIPEMLARVLAARDVSLESAADFLSPAMRTCLPDPAILKDMEAAASRLARAVHSSESVCVFGDYDVDGATSAALLIRYFDLIGRRIGFYIPDRIDEGYGPNIPALLRLKDTGVSLIVTVDCGTMAHKALGAAKEAGLDVLVVDHHQAESLLPPAFAVVNPNRLDDESGLGHLAAVGVTYLLIVALNRKLREEGWFEQQEEPDLLSLLDLVALGTVCDVVPLTGLNRAYVAQGLKVMARRENVGLRALADVAQLEGTPSTYHAGFLLGPRLNAGGRVGRSEFGTRLLSTKDAREASRIAEQLDIYNKERQAIEAQVLEQAIDMVENMLQQSRANRPPSVILVAGKGWHPGVIGIVASRLKDRYDRPSFVAAIDDKGEAKGSGRSIPGVDIGRAVTAALEAGLLVNGGGHAMAAGMTLAAGNLDRLEQFLEERIGGDVDRVSGDRQLGLDGALVIGGANRSMLEVLEQAGPFGAGNPEPRFAIPRVRVVRASVVGQKHVSCIFSGEDGGRLRGIAFRASETPLGQSLLDGHLGLLHVAGRLKADDWQGRKGVQLHIDDASPA